MDDSLIEGQRRLWEMWKEGHADADASRGKEKIKAAGLGLAELMAQHHEELQRQDIPPDLEDIAAKIFADMSDNLDGLDGNPKALQEAWTNLDAKLRLDLAEGWKQHRELPEISRTRKAVTESEDWLIEGWMPRGRIMMLAGKGGVGKSRLALQLAAAMAGGNPEWLHNNHMKLNIPAPATYEEREPEDRKPRVAIATWEMSSKDIDRRLTKIEGGEYATDADLLKRFGERLHILDFAERGPLWAPSREHGHTSTMGALTPSGKLLRRHCETYGVELLILDPLAAAFGCNENDRALVRPFMASWDGWGRRVGCTVMIISHPPKNEAEYSGSTDWHNAARAVWSFGEKEITDPENGESKLTAKRLDCIKSNNVSIDGKPKPLWMIPTETGFKATSNDDEAHAEAKAANGKGRESAFKFNGARDGDGKLTGEPPHRPRAARQ